MEARDYLHAIRAYGLTQAQVSEKTGIPQPTISKIERGDVSDVLSRNYRALQTLHAELTVPDPKCTPSAQEVSHG
ncbi:helix-turn-helix transcriptional regulator [Acidovorax sp. PRC11]|uniref:helix-turn-helix domain-containing protein n=1 Tax=Acidovorax sp. PRC11 TaxID=2962592 RepID=UPI002882A556|nr:helix-turn-helix transcriptional regulator [Acidovorax sp. PRC11]MDT0140196.1 helix-turn-helix transcriptional regulator [Acidovorax sp. PRC11]